MFHEIAALKYFENYHWTPLAMETLTKNSGPF